MRHMLLFLVLACAGPSLWAASEPGIPTHRRDDAEALASWIDGELERVWKEKGIQPAAAATDYEWVRRVYLDLAGRIPSVFEIRQYMESSSPDRDWELIQEIVDGPGYATYWSNNIRRLLAPEADVNPRGADTRSFTQWLREQVALDGSWNRLAYSLLAWDLTKSGANESTPIEFYIVKQGKPELLAATTTRVFLGTRLECAQCHDHPFAKWTQQDFWQLAAFFAGSATRGPNQAFGTENKEVRSIKIDGTEHVVPATYLDGSQPDWTQNDSPRQSLAHWLTANENTTFAEASANRFWSYLFGKGIVDPVDDFGALNPASHPELLQRIAREFAEHDYDLRFLMSALALTKAYRLSSRLPDAGSPDAQNFERMPLRSLSAEQLIASLFQATGLPKSESQQISLLGPQFPSLGEDLTRTELSLVQALSMMNGDFISAATRLGSGQTLTAVLNYPGFTTSQRIETLYLCTLSRLPTGSERDSAMTFLEKASTLEKEQQAYSDLLWALLNSSEFALNH